MIMVKLVGMITAKVMRVVVKVVKLVVVKMVVVKMVMVMMVMRVGGCAASVAAAAADLSSCFCYGLQEL